MSICSTFYKTARLSPYRAHCLPRKLLRNNGEVIANVLQQYRGYSAAVEQEGVSYNANSALPHKTIVSTKKGKGTEILTRTKAGIARPWDGIPSMAHVYAIVREIERRFGPVREYRLIRDYEIPSHYQTYFFFIFESQESADRMGEDAVIEVAEPDVDVHRIGGIGLDEIQDLLRPAIFDPTLNLQEKQQQSYISKLSEEIEAQKGKPKEKKKDVFQVKLELLHSRFYGGANKVLNETLPTAARMRASAHAYLAWGGGFYEDADSRTPDHNRALADALERNRRMVGPAAAARYDPDKVDADASENADNEIEEFKEVFIEDDIVIDDTPHGESANFYSTSSSPSEKKPTTFLRVDNINLAPPKRMPFAAPTISSITTRVSQERTELRRTQSLNRPRTQKGERPPTVVLTGTQTTVGVAESVPKTPIEHVQWPLPVSAKTESTAPKKEDETHPPGQTNLALNPGTAERVKRLSLLQRVAAVFRGPWL